jgi:hypothetical protein
MTEEFISTLGGNKDRLNDLGVSGTAAKVPSERGSNLTLRWMRVLFEQP